MTAKHFGGLGGIWDGRPVNHQDEFEMAVQRQLGDALREDAGLRVALWGSLANVSWRRDDGSTASYSFRAAGDLVAAISLVGHYMTYYCAGPDGVVDDRIADALAIEGWHPVADPDARR